METILRTTALYWFILLIIRIIPRRIGTITTPFEYLLVFLQGGLAIGVIVINDHSMVNAMIGISSIALNHVGISTLKQRSQRFGRFIDGTPVVVFEEGEWKKDRMNFLLLQPQDILTSARAQVIESEQKIRLAVLERNGDVSVLKKQDS